MKCEHFTISGTLPNLNDYTKACRTNRFAGAEMKKKAEEKVLSCIGDLGHIEGSVRVQFHWIEPNKKRDKDNVCFSKKFILDALVKAGVLTGDGWEYISGFEDTFYVDKENPRIEVTLWETSQTHQR